MVNTPQKNRQIFYSKSEFEFYSIPCIYWSPNFIEFFLPNKRLNTKTSLKIQKLNKQLNQQKDLPIQHLIYRDQLYREKCYDWGSIEVNGRKHPVYNQDELAFKKTVKKINFNKNFKTYYWKQKRYIEWSDYFWKENSYLKEGKETVGEGYFNKQDIIKVAYFLFDNQEIAKEFDFYQFLEYGDNKRKFLKSYFQYFIKDWITSQKNKYSFDYEYIKKMKVSE